jgi:flagellar hook-length control protein FliK
MVLNQAPKNAGADTANQPLAGQQSTSAKQEPLGFKKKLENCIVIDESPYGVPTLVNQTGDIQDNSMATASQAQQVSSEIVGILEGFGMLDYRSDLPQGASENGPGADASAKAVDTLLQGMTQDAEQMGTLEQYARMLSKDQLSRLPEDMQQAILKAVGDYLGSFESTNNKPAQTTAMQDAMQTPETMETAPAATAADTTALPDRIASLLLKLKALTQDTKPAGNSMPADSTLTADSVQNIPSDAVAISTETKAQSAAQSGLAESAENAPAVTMQENAPAQAGQVMEQTDKAKVQTADELPQQAPKADAVVQNSAQAHLFSVQDADIVETKADVSQTAQTDFAKDNVMRIVDKLSTQVSDGKYDFDVELKPDFLGKVHIKLTMENGEIRMQIKTDDIGVKGMFADQASSMQAVLKEKGIAVTDIDITYQSQMQTGDDRQAYRQNGNGGKRQTGRHNTAIEQLAGTGGFETMTEITGYTHTGSSVEYLA